MSLQKVKNECQGNNINFQVMPVQEHKLDPKNQWYLVYQPISEQIDPAFSDLASACPNRLWVDMVLNHMASGEGQGSLGNYFNSNNRQFYGLDNNDFHNNKCQMDYNNKWSIQNCDLLGLPDLSTGNPQTQQKIANVINAVISKGVKGLRMDAAKHVSVEDWKGIYSRVHNKPQIFHEVIAGGLDINEYLQLGLVTEFGYGYRIRDNFRNRNLKNLEFISNGLLPSQSALITVVNHDQERTNDGLLTYRDGFLYMFAQYFTLFNNYGIVAVHSGYSFNSFDQGPPKDCSFWNGNWFYDQGFHCLHKHPFIITLMEVREELGSERVNYWWTTNNAIVMQRRNYIFVVNIGDNIERVKLPFEGTRNLVNLLTTTQHFKRNMTKSSMQMSVDSNFQIPSRTVYLFKQ